MVGNILEKLFAIFDISSEEGSWLAELDEDLVEKGREGVNDILNIKVGADSLSTHLC